MLLRLIAIVGMLLATLPFLPETASGGQIPLNARMAAVRLTIVLRVTPSDTTKPSFPCVIDPDTQDTALTFGSGTIIDPRGYVLTNAHVVTEDVPNGWVQACTGQIPGGGTGEITQELIAYLPNEQGIPTTSYTVEVVRTSDPQMDDLAVVRLSSRVDGQSMPAEFPFVQFGDSDMLELGAPITVLGYPGNAGRNLSVTTGIYSGLTDDAQFPQPRFKTDAVISGGNSGGTALNEEGLLVGIPSNSFRGDCRPYDSNRDGQVSEEDDCIVIGGAQSVLIPSRLGHAFAEQALGETIPILSLGNTRAPDSATEQPDPTEPGPGHGLPSEPSPTPTVTPDGSPASTVSLTPYDANGTALTTAEGVSMLVACVEGSSISAGETFTMTWMRDGQILAEPNTLTWEAAWGTQLCGWTVADPNNRSAPLEPGSYQVTFQYNGSTFTSEPLAVNTASTMPAASPTPTEGTDSPHFSDPAYLSSRMDLVTQANSWVVRDTAGDVPSIEGNRWAYRVGEVPAGANLVAVVDLCQKSALTTVPLLFGVVLWNSPTGIYALVDSAGVAISRNDGSGFETLSSHHHDTVNLSAGACNRLHVVLEGGTLSIWLNSVYVTSIEGVEMHPWSVDLGVWQAANSAPIANPSEPVMSYQTLWLGTFPSP